MRRNLAILLVGMLIGGLMLLQAPSPAATTNQRIKKLNRQVRKLNRQVRVLRNKTQHMNRRGFYGAGIWGFQVFSLCGEEATATWTDEFEGATVLDVCDPEASSQRMLRRAPQR